MELEYRWYRKSLFFVLDELFIIPCLTVLPLVGGDRASAALWHTYDKKRCMYLESTGLFYMSTIFLFLALRGFGFLRSGTLCTLSKSGINIREKHPPFFCVDDGICSSTGSHGVRLLMQCSCFNAFLVQRFNRNISTVALTEETFHSSVIKTNYFYCVFEES